MNNNNKIKIYIFICFLITSLFTEDRNFVIRDYMENGNIDALIKNVEDEIYLVQLFSFFLLQLLLL